MTLQLYQALVPLLILLLGGIGWLYRYEKEKRREIEKQLSQKKYDVYVSLMELFFKMFKSVKQGKDIDPNKLSLELIDIKKDMIVYSSDEVYKAFNIYLISMTKGTSHLRDFANLAIAFRKDMGLPNTKLVSDDILLSIMQDEDEFRKAKEQGLF